MKDRETERQRERGTEIEVKWNPRFASMHEYLRWMYSMLDRVVALSKVEHRHSSDI
jgi:hypothetical protein